MESTSKEEYKGNIVVRKKTWQLFYIDNDLHVYGKTKWVNGKLKKVIFFIESILIEDNNKVYEFIEVKNIGENFMTLCLKEINAPNSEFPYAVSSGKIKVAKTKFKANKVLILNIWTPNCEKPLKGHSTLTGV